MSPSEIFCVPTIVIVFAHIKLFCIFPHSIYLLTRQRNLNELLLFDVPCAVDPGVRDRQTDVRDRQADMVPALAKEGLTDRRAGGGCGPGKLVRCTVTETAGTPVGSCKHGPRHRNGITFLSPKLSKHSDQILPTQVTSLSPRSKEIKGQVLTINLQNRMRCDWAVTVGQGGEACSGQVIPRAFLGQGLYTRTAGQPPRRHGARRDVCCEKKQCWLKTAKELRRTVGSSADREGSSEGERGASTCLMPGTVSAEGGGPGLQATCAPGPHSHLDWCSWTRVQQTEQTLVEFLRS